MKDCYTACDRCLLKELMIILEPIIKKSLVGDKQININYFLPIFEQEIGVSHILEESYNLKALPISNCNEL